MELFLIRHAQSANNALPEAERVEDPGLTNLGTQQAERLATWMPTLGLTRLITSPFRRTLLTARGLAVSTGLKPHVRVDLHEVGGCYRGHVPGSLEGRPGMNQQQIRTDFPEVKFDDPIADSGWWESKPYETTAQVAERADRLLRRTLAEFAETHERIAYVMHADFKLFFIDAFGSSESLEVPRNTSVSRITCTAGVFSLREYNQTGHLEPALLSF
jgi:2,3-bisphosphoglycerate-dependent phosphoglycerate mutase